MDFSFENKDDTIKLVILVEDQIFWWIVKLFHLVAHISDDLFILSGQTCVLPFALDVDTILEEVGFVNLSTKHFLYK